jgi:hypothetical protein
VNKEDIMNKKEKENKTPQPEKSRAAVAGAEFDNTPEPENRAADFGESGQFAPGGYYNQQGAAKRDRVDLDEELAPRRQVGNRQ